MVVHTLPPVKGWLDAVAVLGHMVKDRESRGHNRRVAQLCVRIGRQMAMTAAELRVLAQAGLMHDIGKVAIPEHILDKHAPLDQAEWTLMKSHPEMGISLLGDSRSRREMLAVLYHHRGELVARLSNAPNQGLQPTGAATSVPESPKVA